MIKICKFILQLLVVMIVMFQTLQKPQLIIIVITYLIINLIVFIQLYLQNQILIVK